MAEIYDVLKYETDTGVIANIRLSRDKADVAGNTQPNGATTTSSFVKISKSNREFGIKPRGVVLQREDTAQIGGGDADPDNNEEIVIKYNTFLPILQATVFAGATFAVGTQHTYQGTSWKVVAKKSEDY